MVVVGDIGGEASEVLQETGRSQCTLAMVVGEWLPVSGLRVWSVAVDVTGSLWSVRRAVVVGRGVRRRWFNGLAMVEVLLLFSSNVELW
jgi:hypothetical protein